MQTFYLVRYSTWGADQPYTKVFTSREAANKFYRERDFVDPPKKYTPRKKSEEEHLLELCAIDSGNG